MNLKINIIALTSSSSSFEVNFQANLRKICVLSLQFVRMASSSSNAEPSAKKYDVFISFRGEDTRANFTSHLHTAFNKNSIETYIDYKLTKGDDIWPTLCEAIEQSHIAVVVFSKDYAGSKWCLEELVKILECRKYKGQVVIPVFYQTDPSHIRKQIGSYGEAFAKYERDLMDNESNQKKVQRWRAALKEAADIAGWDSRTHKDESQVIQNITNDVLQKLYLRYPPDLKGLVGIDKNYKQLELLLKKGTKAIGIWSMGGIGKTTIAKVMFAKLFPQYDTVCFLENVREESQKLGLTYSRDKLLFELLKEENLKSNAVRSALITRRLRNRKAFIVLDDVNSSEQLDYLYGDFCDVGSDSRVVITTRDRHLLRGRVDEVYELKKCGLRESLELFSLHAFKKNRPEKGYELLSERAVEYAGGIPLALKVLGSYLYSRSHEFWESTLRKLEKYPNESIQNVLKVSYDGLECLEKSIFLDIAFFFKNDYKDYAVRILDACGFYATSGIDVLIDKALITISYNNTIQMHDLLQEMGLDIVRQECSRDPGRRSRLREIEEVCDVLKNDKGTDEVEGITLDLSLIEDLHLSADTFSLMPNLRYLKLHVPSRKGSGNVSLPSVLKPFSDELRYFEWNGYPLKSLPPSFCAKLLVTIRMPHSHIEELWQGIQDLKNLEGIDLSKCKRLKELPDLSRASKLKWLYLDDCESLSHLHPSILSLDTLETLMLDGCKNLKSLKIEKHLGSLKMVSVDGCPSLREFSLSSDLIENLDLSETAIEMLHSSIGHLSNLTWLNLEGLRLQNLPNELSSLKSLENLRISNTKQVINKHKLHVLFDGLRSLKVLHLKDCCNLCELPDNINVLSWLHELRLDGSSVESLPPSIKQLQELEILSLVNCKKLRYLPELSPVIKEFHAINCVSLVTVSTLKTFAVEMKGKKKHILFKNDLNLDERSLHCIMEGALVTMMSAAFHNILVRRYSVYTHSYNYNSVEVCFPGSIVPRQFTIRGTDSCIAVKIPSSSNLLGFIFCVVLAPSNGIKKHDTQIQCQCYRLDGTKVGYETRWHHNAVTDLNSDHIFVRYDPFYCDSILKSYRQYEQDVSFQFCIANWRGERDGLFAVKECAVRLIYYSEFHSFLHELELGLDRKVEMGLKLGLAMDMELRLPQGLERRLLNALEQGLEMDASVKSEFESRRRATLIAIESYDEKESHTQNQGRDLELEESRLLLGLEIESEVESGSSLTLTTTEEYDNNESVRPPITKVYVRRGKVSSRGIRACQK